MLEAHARSTLKTFFFFFFFFLKIFFYSYVLLAIGSTSGSDALATAAQIDTDADIFVTVDSDTVLDPGAIAALLGAFRDQRVLGATALVRVLTIATSSHDLST